MATRGIKQLQKLTLSYCEHGGSSRYVREFISSGRIVDYARANPTVQVAVEVQNGRHPNVNAEYLTGWDKQVCVKNEPINRISNVIQMLNDSSGRKMNRIDGPVQTQTPSVQGIWTPFLDIRDKKFGMEIVQDGDN
mmetsp:Transcript_28989/g.58836  ORF Transcript_28989/g.58836 Transcript_28989/m.58836 type:complete len:136 (+) Transcript_28989:90-497(+)